MLTATLSISRSDFLPHKTQANRFTARYPHGSTTTVLSVQPHGGIETRPMGTDGSYETFKVEGNRAVWLDVGGNTFAMPVVD